MTRVHDPAAYAAAERDAAFERDVLPCLPDVARFARALTRDAADADDLVQETFLQAYRGYHTFIPGADARRWLFTICRHTHAKRWRRAGRQAEVAEGGEAELEALAAVRGHAAARRAGEDDLFDRLDVGPAIAAAVAELAPAFRTAVELVDVQGQSYEEAAGVEGVPVGTIRSRLFRARRLLQERLLTHARDAGLAAGPTARAPRPRGVRAATPDRSDLR
jgi:RNA polymerase sigma-70 factor (ECF subfamily)